MSLQDVSTGHTVQLASLEKLLAHLQTACSAGGEGNISPRSSDLDPAADSAQDPTADSAINSGSEPAPDPPNA